MGRSKKNRPRSIPSMVDGLKPVQRKALFCAFKKNLVHRERLVEFSCYASENSAYPYHHERESLTSTIIGMAQDYVGSNNINLLLPHGQFGTRNQHDKDHASSARYLSTELSPVTRILFHKDDDNLLDYLEEDGIQVEPKWYVPIIPMVLVNGCRGIGSFVPNYNPLVIIQNIKHLLNDEPMEAMIPWYKGFKGSIKRTATEETSYTVSGIIKVADETTLRITELPILKWTHNYKEFLKSVSADNAKSKDPFIKGFRGYSCLEIVHITVFMSNEQLLAAKAEGLLKKFKLTTCISTTNMHLLDSNGVMKKYNTPEEILEEFFRLRLDFYKKRKETMLANKKNDILKCENKYRFIKGVVEGSIIFGWEKDDDFLNELKEKGFKPLPNEIVIGKGVSSTNYDYLLPLSFRKGEKVLNERDNLQQEVDKLEKTTAKSLWLEDLDALEKKLEQEYTEFENRYEENRERIHGMFEKRNEENRERMAKMTTTKKAAAVEPMEVSDNTTDKIGEVNKKPKLH